MNDILKPFKEYFTMNKNGEYSHLKRTMLTVFHVRFVFVLFETLGFCKSVRVVFPDLRSLMGCCVLAFSPLSKEEIFPFIKITHNSRYSFKYTWFFIEFIRCLLEYEDKEQALQQAEQRCDVEVNRQNLCNGNFVVDTVESVVNWFMAGNSYKECVFSAINSGKSSDAVGALTGLLAGIYYGLELKNGVKGFETMESYIDSFIQYLNHPTL